MNRVSLILSSGISWKAAVTAMAQFSNLPPDPFEGGLPEPAFAADYSLEVDRARGKLLLPAREGSYTEGSHFAGWLWNLEANRGGRYAVAVQYTSKLPKTGIQVKVGEDAVLKGYAPRSGGDHDVNDIVVGFVRLPDAAYYPVMLLTGESSNGPALFVKSISLTPAPDTEPAGQSIDGTIELPAAGAATYSESLRYESGAERDCLGNWTDEKDWAEWIFDVSSPGRFKVEVFQRCDSPGNAGSEAAVLVNDHTLKFAVEPVGGSGDWKPLDLGTVEIPVAGKNKVAIKALSRKGATVMEIRKIVLTPVAGQAGSAGGAAIPIFSRMAR